MAAAAAAAAGKPWRRLLPRAGWLPTLQSVRHAKAVTRHRRVMHFERQKLMAVTEYIAPKPAIPPRCLPPPPKPPKEESGLVRLLRQELQEVFQKNRMIAICQNVNLSAEDKLLMRHQLRKHDIWMKVFPNEVLKPFLAESKFRVLLPLFVGHNMLLVSPEPKAREMLRILRTVPFLPLLGGCIDNTILSYQGFVKYSKLHPLSVFQGELVGGLGFPASQTHFMLQYQPLWLATLLDQYLRQQREGEAAGPTPGASPHEESGTADPEPARGS
ncbi:39S ribosomal protein L10, mitochondrial [Tachyglossus aculeatus]|uniref:39S ribosomal protein L10, mitochondrial n=1 Tax=Tachyglossus aculeatus TaxID=9261 RepID=UPI0018F3AC57|nr:39S ribosomal protein L10, mitochondrial [Tachyglossus aculeatus]